MRPTCWRAASPRPAKSRGGATRSPLAQIPPELATRSRRRAGGEYWATASVQVIDLRPSMSYRKEHIAGAVWSIRPRIATAADAARAVVLVADEPGIAALAALDLARGRRARRPRLLEAGTRRARRRVADGVDAGRSARRGLHRLPVLHRRPPRGRRGRRAAVPRPGRSAWSPSSTRRSAARSGLPGPA